MMISLLMLLSIKVFAMERPDVVYKNNQAEKLFKEEKISDSRIVLEKEVVNHPKAGPLHYNLGVIHENSKEPEKALREYKATASMTSDQVLKFKSHFNAARVYGEQKDIPNALKQYQAALDLMPESQEVKTNIELLFQGNGGGGNQSQEDQKSDQQKEDQKQQQGQKPQEPQQQGQKKNQAPKPFKSEELSNQDVRRILDELKRQEEQIRAKMNDKKSKESPDGKDW